MWRRTKNVIQYAQSDVKRVFERDPAARSVAEVVLTYSGLHAIWLYRIAHWFYSRKWFLLGKMISVLGRFLTAIEIHPGAKIGKDCFIDHGVGVVIGETCEIGDHVTIYQGVTLGGTGKEKGKRHPTVGDGVMISSGAKVIGSIQVGKCSKIGAGSVVLNDVPPYSTVVGVPGRVVAQNGVRVSMNLDQVDLVDSLNEKLRLMEDEIRSLKKKYNTLKKYKRNEVSQIEWEDKNI